MQWLLKTRTGTKQFKISSVDISFSILGLFKFLKAAYLRQILHLILSCLVQK